MENHATVKDVLPDVGNNFRLDDNVKAELPAGCEITNSVVYGTAAWTRAARIIVVLEDGTEKSYFLKCATDEQGKRMIEGEYASMSEIAKYDAAFAPAPYAHGQFKDSPVPSIKWTTSQCISREPPTSLKQAWNDVLTKCIAAAYFFLMEFLDIQTGAPDPMPFCESLARLHRDSVSPTGKFGFHIITCHGPHPQNTQWEDSWSVFFTRLLRQFFDREIDTNGHDEHYEALFKELEAVVPKILDPLQAEGRYLKPCLLHGDLWEENTGTSLLEGGQPKVFDAAVFYGHNEFELGMWRRDIIHFGRAHTRQYLKFMPPSEPSEQWDDRNRLYALKFEMAHAIGWPATCESQRAMITRDMKFLVSKYSP